MCSRWSPTFVHQLVHLLFLVTGNFKRIFWCYHWHENAYIYIYCWRIWNILSYHYVCLTRKHKKKQKQKEFWRSDRKSLILEQVFYLLSKLNSWTTSIQCQYLWSVLLFGKHTSSKLCQWYNSICCRRHVWTSKRWVSVSH